MVGALAQVSSELNPARVDWGNWGVVDRIIDSLVGYTSSRGQSSIISKRHALLSHCVVLSTPPSKPKPWRIGSELVAQAAVR